MAVFTGYDLRPVGRVGNFSKSHGSGPVVSGHEVFKLSRVGSGHLYP